MKEVSRIIKLFRFIKKMAIIEENGSILEMIFAFFIVYLYVAY
ncbi:MAG: hypothetical protein ACKVTZ_18685 [Bacteroidia bacterium]